MAKKKVKDMIYHYTYRITNTVENKYYYGVHSCDCLPKEDIGVKYFSSSKNVEFKTDIKNNPQNYKYKVVKIFQTRYEANRHEDLLHKKFDVKNHKKFYNNWNSHEKFTSLGISKTKKHKEKISKSNKGKKFKKGYVTPDSTKLKISINNGRYWKGKNLSDETKLKMSESHTGKKQEIVECPNCLKVGGISNMKRYHFDNCRNK